MTSASLKSPAEASPSNGAIRVSKSLGMSSQEVSLSARKLAATLWEINKANACALEKQKGPRRRERNGKVMHHSDRSCSPDSEVGIRNRLKYVSTGLAASKELLKVITRLCGIDEHPSSAMSLVSALRLELDRARFHVEQLSKDQQLNHDEIGHALKLFEEEKAAWRRKEREKMRNGMAHIAEELEIEKKLRKQTERLNKKLGKELADAKTSLLKMRKELETERRCKEILEQVCDELATGIGEDRAAAEEIKRQSVKVRKEVEKEREMLHLAHVLREERVQMKLSEAKFHFEEKNAAVEMLRNELENYLIKRKEGDDGSPDCGRIKELEDRLSKFEVSHKHPREDDAESDLHSIELNMDNTSRSYKWSYASDAQAPELNGFDGDENGDTTAGHWDPGDAATK